MQNMAADERKRVVPRVCILGGKAPPGYEFAKKIVKLVHAIGEKVNNDPEIGDLLKVVGHFGDHSQLYRSLVGHN